MSRQFLTLSQAGEKLQRSLSGNDFITKQQAIAAGADENKLTGYSDNEYPVDDDINAGSSWGIFDLRFEGSLPGTSQSVYAGEVLIFYVPSEE